MSAEDDDIRAQKIIDAGDLFAKTNDKNPNTDNDNDGPIHVEPLFEEKYTHRESSAKEDLPTQLLQYINQALLEIRPSDAFTKTNRTSDEAAKNFLQSDDFLRNFSFAQAALAAPHELNGEIRQKSDEILSIAKALFKDADIFKNWKGEINRRKQKARDQHHGSDNYTPTTIPDGYWFSSSNKGSPITSYAVSSARNVEVSCNRLPAKIQYDPFDATFRVEYDGELKTMNSARQVRNNLLVPIANMFGYEARRDHFEDFIEALKSDEGRHYDSLIHFYDAWESDYDPNFKCIDECVSILDTENDDYTREGLRSFLLGHVQRAYFPGCELQRIISLIGPENIGKSTLIKIKAGNFQWDEKAGIRALRWYSNKNIINPQMSDRDRHSACIGINMFEFDERRGQRAIENEHFRSFVTSTYDDFRIWMGMEPVRVLRRWDMVASTNHSDYNSDGFIRRDWGINVGVTGKRIDLPTFIELYPKITAWAVHHVKAGMSAIPDYSLYEKAKVRQRGRVRQTDTMDFLEPVFAFAHLDESGVISRVGATRIQEEYHVSFKDDKETKQRTYMIDQVGLSNFASDYKRFYNRSGNTDKHAIKNDILNVEVRPVIEESISDSQCFMWKPMTKPVNMWSTFLNRAIRGYILVVDAPHTALVSTYAYQILLQELPFIEMLLNKHTPLEDIHKKEKCL